MSRETKLIIITDDLKALEQFQFDQMSNFKIIDFTNTTPQEDANRSKITEKFSNNICAICGGDASGKNYGVVSCGSCKIFFRRNANKDLNKLRCLSINGQCSLGPDARKKCPKCRLKKCFQMGMRKDKITSTGINTHSTFSNNPTTLQNDLDQLLMDIELKLDDKYLSIEDRMIIEYIQSITSINLTRDKTEYRSLNIQDHRSAIIYWTYIANERVLCFVNFFQQINEFQSLNGDDRFLLFKHNLLYLFPLFMGFYYNRLNHCLIYEDFEESFKRLEFYKLCFESARLHILFLDTVRFISEITDQDSTTLSLLILILLFSPDLLMNTNATSLQDPLTIYKIQSNYTNILWKYLIDKQGEVKASIEFLQIIRSIFRIQSVIKKLFNFFQFESTILNITDDIAPLMQSILHIS